MLGQGNITDPPVLFQTQERALPACRCNDDHMLRLSHVGGQRDFLAVVVPLGACQRLLEVRLASGAQDRHCGVVAETLPHDLLVIHLRAFQAVRLTKTKL